MLVTSCNLQQGGTKKEKTTSEVSLSPVSISNIEVDQESLEVTGKNLSNIKSMRIIGTGINEVVKLDTSKNNTDSRVWIKPLSKINLMLNQTVSLLIQDSVGQSVFSMNFDLADGAVTANKLHRMGASTGQILKYNGSSWGPGDLSTTQYVGVIDSSTSFPLSSPAGGDFYIVTENGSYDFLDGQGSRSFNNGDWAIYNSLTNRYDQISLANAVTGFNGRVGSVLPEDNDYTWNQIDKSVSDINDIANVDVTGAQAGQVIKYDGTNWVAGDDSTAAGGGTTTTESGTVILNGDADDNGSGDISFQLGSSEKMRITNTGEIGIGTNAPRSLLEVNGNGAQSFRLTGNTGQKRIVFGNQDGPGTNNPSVIAALDGKMYFGGGDSWLDSNGGNINTTMTIDDTNGRVGIGTTNPSEKLHIQSPAGSNESIAMGSFNVSSDFSGQITGSKFGSLIKGGTNSHIAVALQDNDVNDSFQIVSGGGDYMSDKVYDTTVFRATANGNVAIGKSVPTAKLDVDGRLKARSLNTIITKNTGSSSTQTGYWFEIGSTSLKSQYASGIATMIVSKRGTSGGTGISHGLVTMRVKQQNTLGNPPITNVILSNARRLNPNDFAVVVTENNSSTTFAKFYIRNTTSHEQLMVSFINSSGVIPADDHIDGVASLPAGAITYGSGDIYTDTNGKVGIGTINPQVELEVVGSLNVGGAYAGGSNNVGKLMVNGDGPNEGVTVWNNTGATTLRLWSDDTKNTGHLSRGTSADNGITINQNGKIGIGTSSPTKQLDIKTSDSLPLRLYRTGNTINQGVGIEFSKQNSANVDKAYGRIFVTPTDNTNGDENSQFIFRNIINGTYTDSMIINGDGRVGIGTTSPKSELDLNKGSLFFNKGAPFNGVYWGEKYTDDLAHTGEWAYIRQSSSNGQLEIGSDENIVFYETDGRTPQVTMQMNSGNVGIGIINPTHKLHVIGTAGLSTGTAWTNTSDARLKDIRGKYVYGLDEIRKLNTVRFNYRKDNELGLPSDNEIIGFIAQEVKEILPEAVYEREDGFLELNVDPIHWAGINAIQELDKNQRMFKLMQNGIDTRVKKLERKVASLEDVNNNLKSEIQNLKSLNQNILKRLEALEKISD